MGGRLETGAAAFKLVDREGLRGVESHTLLPLEQGGRTQVALTRVRAGGEYATHVDEYAQIFCVVEGRGEGEVDGERIVLEPGVIMRTEVDQPHALYAADDEPLLVMVVNTYPAD